MKKFFTFFLALATSVGTMIASVTIDGIAYNLNETDLTAEVTWSGKKSGSVVIPSSVNYNSVTYSVTSIGDMAFWGCSSLTSVTIPNSVTSIGDYAFYECTGLTSIDIPNSVTSIGYGVFECCSSLPVVDNIRYADTYLIEAVDKSSSSYTISESTRWVGSAAFYGCTSLTSVTIPNSVTSIEGLAFGECAALTSVTIPNSVTSIGSDAFSDCTGLISVTIPNSVTSIGEGAFHGCTSLTSVTIPNSVTSIGYGVFEGCTGRKSPIYNSHVFAYMPTSYSGAYAIPDGIESIAGDAFFACTRLTSVTIPNSVTSIGGSAFSCCKGLTSVTIPNSVTSIGWLAFYNCTSLTSVTIPNSVTSIGYQAFYYCTSLTSVTIGNSVTSIGEEAFHHCTSLTDIFATCGDSDRLKQLLNNDSRVKDAPSPYTIMVETNGNGYVDVHDYISCDSIQIVATPDYGYHFIQWNDGNTDNPRTIELTQDTTFTAEFAKNTYTISTASNHTEWGMTIGGQSALYQEEIEISATANDGYHFAQWNDGNTQNPRTVIVTEDMTYTANFAKNTYSITKNADHGSISGSSQAEYMDKVKLTVTPDYGYHFAQWSDGNTDNPRTIELTQDTTFTAEFAKNTYSIHVGCDEIYGYINGENGEFDYLTNLTYKAVPNRGYHFVQWSDGNTDNPRTITLRENMNLTAEFAKNTYTLQVNCDESKGQVSGMGVYEYLDEVTLTVTPDYGYHFVQWNDGNTDNPRKIVLTQDTTITAEFAIDKSGTCGENMALNWAFEDSTKTLTISGSGALTENYTFGLEAPTQMEHLIIGNDVTAIGDSAFYGKTTIAQVTIGGNVTSIGSYAFADIDNRQLTFLVMPAELTTIGDHAFSGNTYLESIDFNAKLLSIGAYAFKDCRRVSEMTCMAETTPDVGTKALISINSHASLCVPVSCVRKYQVDPNWGRFDLCELGATTSTGSVTTVTVEPSDNTAIFTWPTENDSATYTLQITKDGEVFCTLIFSANGQLIGIAFAPSRTGAPHAPAATLSNGAMQFTVTGLNVANKYAYRLSVSDASGVELQSYSGEFATIGYEGDVNPGGEPEYEHEAVEQLRQDPASNVQKLLINGQILILRGDKIYSIQGQEVK